jgi:hypothetical protein
MMRLELLQVFFPERQFCSFQIELALGFAPRRDSKDTPSVSLADPANTRESID